MWDSGSDFGSDCDSVLLVLVVVSFAASQLAPWMVGTKGVKDWGDWKAHSAIDLATGFVSDFVSDLDLDFDLNFDLDFEVFFVFDQDSFFGGIAIMEMVEEEGRMAVGVVD